jgi:acetoin utilization deacetylase AcuC-like enzyme
MFPFPLIYRHEYDLNLGDHVFPTRIFRLTYERLIETGVATPGDFRAPEPADDADILKVHERSWVQRLRTLTLSDYDIMRLEIPVSRKGVEAAWLMTGGSILAAELALTSRIAANLGGGFHHAFPDHGEGFCALNDFAVAIRKLQSEGKIRKAMVVDLDVHHGNGTAAIFAGDDTVFTLSMHQRNNYPAVKPPSDLDVHLPNGVGDAEYLKRLREAYIPSLEAFQPELIVYVAGADPYQEDMLGGLDLTLDGLLRRDRIVFDEALKRGFPVMVVLAGGYARDVEDTVTIHVNTVLAARDALTIS